jgi:superfamily II DNA or RNA helicase
VVSDREILAALFNAGRRAAKSIKAFEAARRGLSLVQPHPWPHVLLDNILELELRPDQEEALETFARTGSMTAAHAMSFGKSTLGMMAMTRISGRHLLMVDTQMLREQWIEAVRAGTARRRGPLLQAFQGRPDRIRP